MRPNREDNQLIEREKTLEEGSKIENKLAIIFKKFGQYLLKEARPVSSGKV